MPLNWLPDGPRVRGQHTKHSFWFARVTTHYTAKRCCTRRTGRHPSHTKLIVASIDGHLELQRPPNADAWRGGPAGTTRPGGDRSRAHTLGMAHATAYVHASDLTTAAPNHRALRARDGHTPVQQRLCIQKEQLSDFAVLSAHCLLCGSREETPVHMHVGCAHSLLPGPHYCEAIQEAAQHLPPGDNALWVASWRSAGAE